MKLYNNILKHSIKIILFSIIFCTSCKDERLSSREIFEKYEGNPGVISFQLPPGLFTLFMDQDIGDELDLLMKDVTKIKVISIDNKTFQKKHERPFRKEFEEIMNENNFESAMVFANGGNLFNFRLRNSEDNIEEIVITMASNETFFAVSLLGEIPMKKFLHFSKNVNPFRLMEVLEKSAQKRTP